MLNQFICKDCKVSFEDPSEHLEKHGLDSPPYEKFATCPSCGSTNFAEAVECAKCCNVFPADELSGDDLCPACILDEYKRNHISHEGHDYEIVYRHSELAHRSGSSWQASIVHDGEEYYLWYHYGLNKYFAWKVAGGL